MEYQDVVRDVLSNDKLRQLVAANLQVSMSGIGFSESFIKEFLDNIITLELSAFIEKHKAELQRVEIGHFFGEVVPDYFEKYIVPEVPSVRKVLDLGCGPAVLIKLLIKRGMNEEIVGMDIKASPEWQSLASDKVRFEVVQENDFLPFLEKEQPDTVTATWVFHHMEYDQQERYLRSIYKVLKKGAEMVVLEDAFSVTLRPELGQKYHNEFLKLSSEERHRIMGTNDWIANRVFSMRTTMPVPFAYRTLEDWKKIFEESGFTVTKTRFLGFPTPRDVFNPQSVLVAHK